MGLPLEKKKNSIKYLCWEEKKRGARTCEMDEALQAILLCDMSRGDREEAVAGAFERGCATAQASTAHEPFFCCRKRPHNAAMPDKETGGQMRPAREYNADLAGAVPDEAKHAP
ncbi:hypothetical protein pneo_cds_91 [Pandoravirus neocaledonia]|uniref:Uncharacterized protein n=1 Tax=Pandoravirus neocaledonia TaxID=2107708 RepID=A0A2U7UB66_9VIRU|nr:hypothetical protein pneo_cds_91 [Pandoravirus neocaledonia]AVK75698.1 hypothetical protein pneo_cds_91 [Pandoravirus neocaledonia]